MNNPDKNTDPTELQLIQMHRDWWKDSYGTQPNSQASIVAAAFARYAIETLAQDYINNLRRDLEALKQEHEVPND